MQKKKYTSVILLICLCNVFLFFFVVCFIVIINKKIKKKLSRLSKFSRFTFLKILTRNLLQCFIILPFPIRTEIS